MFSKSLNVILGSFLAANLSFAAQQEETKKQYAETDFTAARRNRNKISPDTDKYDQGHATEKEYMTGGYNMPARIDVRGDYDLFITGTFIYWEPLAEGLDVGVLNPTTSAVINGNNADGKLISLDFNFKPGFKAGLGVNINHGDWDLYAEYTRFHQTSITGNVAAPNLPNGNILPLWIQDTTAAQSASAKWRLKMDILDGEMGRSYYLATKLTFRPFWGVRAAWIDQKYTANYIMSSQNIFSKNTSESVGGGARAGLDTNWIFGYGFRFIGNFAGSILYTHYKLTTKQNDVSTPSQLSLSTSEKKNFLRPNAEFALGVGWGTYFCNSGFHIDIAATYEFQAFWSQNLLRNQWDSIAISFANTFNDLTVHGLNVTARFDF